LLLVLRQSKHWERSLNVLEEEMRNRGFAAAWETFNYPDHMRLVKSGHAIFMFAKGVGVIGIGIAKGECEVLEKNDPDRIRNFSDENKTVEWRVPVQWLEWKDEADAYKWKSPPRATFLDVTDARHKDFRENVTKHFLGSI
jgi:hypothetical protein